MAGEIVKSARRVLDVFELFERERRPLSLKEICAAFALAPSSGSALLKSIVALGYLDYDRGTHSYFPTMRIALVGSWVEGALFGDGAILRLMEHLHAATGETVMLATHSDLSAQYVHAVHSAEPLQVTVPPGTLRPLATSGMGWLLLSRCAEDEIEKLCRRIDIASGRVDRAALKRNVAAARRDGYVFSKHSITRGTGIIAMLLPQGPFGRTFAIGIAGLVRQLESKQPAILAAMRKGIRDFLVAPAQKPRRPKR